MSEEDYNLCRRGLAQLQKLTNILPAIKQLNGEVAREGRRAVENGLHSQIWKGLWLNEIPVSLFRFKPHLRGSIDDDAGQVALKVIQEVRVSRRSEEVRSPCLSIDADSPGVSSRDSDSSTRSKYGPNSNIRTFSPFSVLLLT